MSVLEDGIGTVELLGHMGGDLSVVNAARVSYAKESREFTDRDAKLIRYLMSNGHGSPFEHIVLQLRVKAPMFVVRQWHRHRMASYNERSLRWTEFDDEFYVPDGDAEIAEHFDKTYALYERKLAEGMPKEKARAVLPIAAYTEFWVTLNARSLMNFLMLRNDDHAQAEIHAYAAAVEEIFAKIAPEVWAAFVDNGRKAP